MTYVPDPYDGGSLERYLQQELQKLSDILLPIVDGNADVRHVVPTKPRSGIYFADGLDWDPGSGRGAYRFDEDLNKFFFLEGGTRLNFGTWRFRTETATPPASGQVRFNNATIASATLMYIHETTDDAADVSAFLALLAIGDILYIQERSNADNNIIVDLTSVTDSGTYFTLGITNIIEEGTTPAQNTRIGVLKV